MDKKPFLFSGKIVFVAFVLSAIIFAAIFIPLKTSLIASYDENIKSIPTIQDPLSGNAGQVRNYTSTYGALAGLALGLVLLIFTAVLYIFFAVARLTKLKISAPLALLIGSAIILVWSYNLVYDTPHFTAISSGIVLILGLPIYYTSIVLTGMFLILTIFSVIPGINNSKAVATALLLVSSTMFLGGCNALGDLTTLSCTFSPDSPHCYQEAAVASGEPAKCEKIAQKDEFKELGSNPPKDKCYLYVAENKGDVNVCKNIKGGTMSYTVAECTNGVMQDQEQKINAELKNKDKLTPEKMAEIQKKLNDYQQMNNMMSNVTKEFHDMNMAVVGGLRQ
jgi:hypothetical protein